MLRFYRNKEMGQSEGLKEDKWRGFFMKYRCEMCGEEFNETEADHNGNLCICGAMIWEIEK